MSIQPRIQMYGIKNKQQALRIVASLSAPSKMPCYSYSISAFDCKVGAKLRDIDGSVCSECYAMNGWYRSRTRIKELFVKRLKAIQDPQWHFAMIYLIRANHWNYFRWHDSGDLQSVVHLAKIAFIAKNTPDCLHWLPTREYEIVESFWQQNSKQPLKELFPNLIIRLSAHMINQNAPYELAERLGVTVSEVRDEHRMSPFVLIDKSSTVKTGHCEAFKRTRLIGGGKGQREVHGYCGNCRNCWSNDMFNVVYPLH